jgi:ferredoxin--NADP+ reductase
VHAFFAILGIDFTQSTTLQEAIVSTESAYVIAVVGAGPAGLFAARQLANSGAQVALLNRDIKPGGLAEYGIYYDKYKMKHGLRKQFRQIMELPNVHYFGNVTVGAEADLSLEDLQAMGFQALLVAAGAQGTKWLGLEGEDLTGVYHAKDLVYHYNSLPPYSQQEFSIGRRVALIGAGNVMMDIAHWVIHDRKVDQAIAIVRRGPAEVKFTKAEMENVGANLDIPALDAELERARPVMEALGQDVAAARAFIVAGLAKAHPAVSDSRFLFDFLASPVRILGENGRVTGLEVEETTLSGDPADPKARGRGVKRVVDVDTVVFCIGDKVDEGFGLPVQWNAFVKHPNPAYPVAGFSYEAFDPNAQQPIAGVFVAGWSREASSGLVGIARKDGENGAQAVLQYLNGQEPGCPPDVFRALTTRLHALGKPVITNAAVSSLEGIEAARAQAQGLEDFKFTSNEEMVKAIHNA